MSFPSYFSVCAATDARLFRPDNTVNQSESMRGAVVSPKRGSNQLTQMGLAGNLRSWYRSGRIVE
jgi:hypothetical protein